MKPVSYICAEQVFHHNTGKNMKRIVLAVFLLALFFGGCKQGQRDVNFIVASDMGRRGVSEQQKIAALMTLQAELTHVDFVAVAGDPIHDDGVQSIDDEE